jgi:hypothetical protein
MVMLLALAFTGGVYMTRSRIHLVYNFALILALCVSIGVAVLLLSHSDFCSMPQAAEIPSVSGLFGQLPLLW